MKLLISTLLFSAFIYFGSFAQNSTGAHAADKQGDLPIFSFGVITDIQYADQDASGTRFYRSSLSKLGNALTELKKDSAQFIVNLGDMIDKGFASYKPVMDIIESSGVKTYHITGNHDYSVEPALKEKLPILNEFKSGFYSFVFRKIRFVFLNGNELSMYASTNESVKKQTTDLIAKLKEKGEINAFVWNGGMSDIQLGWLNKQLSEASSKKEKVILLCHFPVVPDSADNLFNYKEIVKYLGNFHNIIAWFNGHSHGGNYGVANKTHFVTFKGMLETENENSFALVKVFKDRLEIQGFGREVSRTLNF